MVLSVQPITYSAACSSSSTSSIDVAGVTGAKLMLASKSAAVTANTELTQHKTFTVVTSLICRVRSSYMNILHNQIVSQHLTCMQLSNVAHDGVCTRCATSNALQIASQNKHMALRLQTQTDLKQERRALMTNDASGITVSTSKGISIPQLKHSVVTLSTAQWRSLGRRITK
jgi:hypothetical protein